jgi:hypothetical protein
MIASHIYRVTIHFSNAIDFVIADQKNVPEIFLERQQHVTGPGGRLVTSTWLRCRKADYSSFPHVFVMVNDT